VWILWYYYEQDEPPRPIAGFNDPLAARMAEKHLRETADKHGWTRYAHHNFHKDNLELVEIPLWRDDEVGK
jgi:hypothetical protein